MPSISGLGSGMDTDSIIKKLVEVESQPIKRLENEIKNREMEKGAWEKVLKALQDLNRKARFLYSVSAPFGQKSADSSDKGVIEARANKYAEQGSHAIKVLQLAQRHKIASDPVDSTARLAKGLIIITVNEVKRSQFFSGGSLQDLFNLLSRSSEKIISVSIIKKTDKSSVLTLESRISGRQGEMEIDDPDGLLKSIGIEKRAQKYRSEWFVDIKKIELEPDKERDQVQSLGNAYSGKDYFYWHEKALGTRQKEAVPNLAVADSAQPLWTMRGEQHFYLPIQDFTVMAGTTLEVKMRSDFLPDPKKAGGTPTNPDDPVSDKERRILLEAGARTRVGAVILEAPDMLRQEKDFIEMKERDLQEHIEDKNRSAAQKKEISENAKLVKGKITVLFEDGSKQPFDFEIPAVNVDSAKGVVVGKNFSLLRELLTHKGKQVKAIELVQSQGVASILSLGLKTPKNSATRITYKNQLQDAQDALLLIGGITVTRTKNEGLDDVVKGLTLTLRNSSEKNIIITVSVDTEKPRKAIEELIKSYNDFLELAKALQTAAVEKEIGNYQRQKKNSGILSADSTLQRLATDIRLMASYAYPNQQKKSIKIFFQIGISTGRAGDSISENQKGHLKIIDENKLIDELRDNYESVKEFFGSDTSGDKKIDNGFAFRLHNYVTNYTQTGRYGLIAAKIQLAEDRIKMAQKSISKQQMHLESYTQRLRRSFQAMEQGMMRTKNEQRWLSNQIKSLGGSGGQGEQ